MERQSDIKKHPAKRCCCAPSVLSSKSSSYSRWQHVPEIFRDELTGKYSIERLRALQEYQQTTSSWRVLFVLLLTPMPSAFIMIASNFVPLQDPEKGLKANWAFFLRALVFFVIVDFANQRQIVFVTKMHIGIIKGLVMAVVGASVMTIALLMTCVAFGRFPVPFSYLMVYAPITILYGICVTRSSRSRLQNAVQAENEGDKPTTRNTVNHTNEGTDTNDDMSKHETVNNRVKAKVYAVDAPALPENGNSGEESTKPWIVSTDKQIPKSRSLQHVRSHSKSLVFGQTPDGIVRSATVTTVSDHMAGSKACQVQNERNLLRASSSLKTLVSLHFSSVKDQSTRKDDMPRADPRPSRDLQLRVRMNSFLKVLSFQHSFIFVYTAFTIAYKQLDSQYYLWQVAYVCLLPVIKKVLTSVDRSRLESLEDIAPETIAFSVKFFSSLYLSICLGTSRTWLISALLIVLDVSHVVLSLGRVKYKCPVFLKHVKTMSQTEKEAFVESCLDIASKNLNFIQRSERDIRTESSNGLLFRRPNMAQLPGRPSVSRRHSMNMSNAGDPITASSQSIESTRPTVLRLQSSSNGSTANDLTSQIQLVRQTLALLYMIEYIALLEYIEAFTPTLYSLYVYATFSGPNHPFFYEIRDLQTPLEMQNSICIMMLYGALELLSFVAVHVYVKWRFGINMFSVVAFVLETHLVNIQSKMVSFVTQILNLMLVHYGVDFSLRFHFNAEQVVGQT